MRRQLRLSDRLRDDIRDVLSYTLAIFGQSQRQSYRNLIHDAIDSLKTHAGVYPSKKMAGAMSGFWVLPISRGSRRASHYVIYRIDPSKKRW